jgi:tetratricopeptide (TPR) repeat protein
MMSPRRHNGKQQRAENSVSQDCRQEPSTVSFPALSGWITFLSLAALAPAVTGPSSAAPQPAQPYAQARVRPPVKAELVEIKETSPDEAAWKTLKEMESRCFGHKYQPPKITEERLEKLELHLFGMTRLGTWQTRIHAIRNEVESGVRKGAETSSRIDPPAGSVHNDESISKALKELELQCFGQESNSRSVEDRLEKLEVFLFSTSRLGGCQARIHALKNAIDSQLEGKPAESAALQSKIEVQAELVPTKPGEPLPKSTVIPTKPGGQTPESTNSQVKPSETAPKSASTPRADQDWLPDPNNNSSVADKLRALENRLCQDEFSSDPLENRLARLEKLVFGQSRKGDAAERLQLIQMVLNENQNQGSRAAAAGEKNRSDLPTHDKNLTFTEAMSTGIANFKLKRFQHAQEDFEQAIGFDPKSPQAYANLGSTLMMLRDPGGAQDAFKASYSLAPFGPLGQYVHNKLLNLAREEAYSKTAPLDTPEMVSRTIKTINRQASDSVSRYRREAEDLANRRMYQGDLEAQRITRQTELDLNDIRWNNRRGRRYRSRYMGGYNYRDQMAEVSNMANIRRNYALTDAQVQANRARTEASRKGSFVMESAANLKNQLLAPVKPGAAQLKSLGTSLYARYYGTSTPSTEDVTLFDPPPPELHAVAKQITASGKESSAGPKSPP